MDSDSNLYLRGLGMFFSDPHNVHEEHLLLSGQGRSSLLIAVAIFHLESCETSMVSSERVYKDLNLPVRDCLKET